MVHRNVGGAICSTAGNDSAELIFTEEPVNLAT